MQNNSQNQTLRAVLAQRQGKGFSEVEATNILRQLLPQVDYLHQQNQAHSQISLNTIIQNNQQIILTATPTPQPANQINIQQDIYALGVVIIELITGKLANSLRNADGSWNWQDYCFVSDQFTDVINRMIGNSAQGRFNYINEIIEDLDFYTPVQSVISLPVNQDFYDKNNNDSEIYSTLMYVIPSVNDTFNNQSISEKLYSDKTPLNVNNSTFIWWGLRGYGVISILILIIGSIVLYLLNSLPDNQEKIAKENIEILYISSEVFYLKNRKFTTNLRELSPLTTTEEEKYSYSINILNDTAIQPIAVANRDGLKSYSGGVFVNSNNTIIPIVCETEKPSKNPPPAPQLVNGKPKCAPGTVQVSY
ncbi:hypothetical protein A0J48_021900 [Sphaerospermopsis aphanizomenoides BCCUSP55]|uniref:type IV pilin-like G/H family protein n=1 Tax=Sphaerospermopsis aphanizomenoides TaxID=459663 RepID=UPI001906D4D7|nr:type IV pilin-like G/H family protein [Sphaerospermopsis aphanizomenoides]MBK1990146.1 hypothetical protein [Sphaerospermopsis aphanizomenoides BCCUSP55]